MVKRADYRRYSCPTLTIHNGRRYISTRGSFAKDQDTKYLVPEKLLKQQPTTETQETEDRVAELKADLTTLRASLKGVTGEQTEIIEERIGEVKRKLNNAEKQERVVAQKTTKKTTKKVTPKKQSQSEHERKLTSMTRKDIKAWLEGSTEPILLTDLDILTAKDW